MERKFILTAFTYVLIGMMLGLYMGGSGNHDEMPTHAHIMLVGFVVSFVYALCHKFWLNNDTSKLSVTQFWLHQAGALAMFATLFIHYAELVPPATIEPAIGLSAGIVFAGMATMAFMMFRAVKTS